MAINASQPLWRRSSIKKFGNDYWIGHTTVYVPNYIPYDGLGLICSFLDVNRFLYFFIIMAIIQFIKYSCVPCSIPSTFQILINSPTIPWGKFHYAQFRNEKTKTQRSRVNYLRFMNLVTGGADTFWNQCLYMLYTTPYL